MIRPAGILNAVAAVTSKGQTLVANSGFRFGLARCGSVWFGKVRLGLVRFGTVGRGRVGFGMVRCGFLKGAGMRSYKVKLEGVTPALMHRDNLEFKAIVNRWQRDPANRDKSVPGDDRSPAWAWIGSLYEDGKRVALPTDCLMASCGGAGTQIKAPRGRNTLKAESQSGMGFQEPFLPLSINGNGGVSMDAVKTLIDHEDFDDHLLNVREWQFSLDVRRAKVGTSKHVRVRPVFEGWSVVGVLNVWNDLLTTEVLQTMFHLAGDRYGILEWRPDPRMKKPGPFGRFKADVTPL